MFEVATPLVLACVAASLMIAYATRRLTGGHLLAVGIFAVYLVGVANFVILPLQHDPQLAAQVFPSEPIPLERMVNLVPFFMPGGDPMSPHQLFYNVLLTVPFGFGFAFVRKARVTSVLGAGVLFSMGIEGAQLLANVARMAMPTWSIDINDVVLNSLGVAIGLAAFLVASRVYRVVAPRLPSSLGPLQHFHETLIGGTASTSRRPASDVA